MLQIDAIVPTYDFTYRLNPNYGGRGSGKEHQKALRTHEKAAAAGLKVHKGGKSARE